MSFNKFLIAVVVCIILALSFGVKANARTLTITHNWIDGANEFCKIHGGLDKVTFYDTFIFNPEVTIICKDGTTIKTIEYEERKK